MPLQCSLYRETIYRVVLGEFFEVFSRSLSTRDGFLTLPNEQLEGFTPDIGKVLGLKSSPLVRPVEKEK